MVKQRGGRLGINMSAVRGDYSGYHESQLLVFVKMLTVTHYHFHKEQFILEEVFGPNMHVHPGSTGLQTGGNLKNIQRRVQKKIFKEKELKEEKFSEKNEKKQI